MPTCQSLTRQTTCSRCRSAMMRRSSRSAMSTATTCALTPQRDVLFLSGDRPDQRVASLRPETQEDVEALDYTLLSDAEATAAIALGIAFRAPSATGLKLRAVGRDIEGSSIDRHGVLPVPAVFAIGTDGKIAYVYANADYRERLSSDELRDVAKNL